MLAAELRRSHPRLRVCTATTLANALEEVERGWLDAAVIDRSLPDGDGLDLVRRLRARGREMPFVLLTADATAASAVECLREGASDYVVKDAGALAATSRALTQLLGADGSTPSRLVGRSAAIRKVRAEVRLYASSDACVLIEGETGVGKELVARALHDDGPRASAPFVAVNSGALPEHLVESEPSATSGGLHWRASRPPGARRARRPRDALPRRGRGSAPGVAGEAAAAPPGGGVPPRRRDSREARGRARGRRLQRGPARNGRGSSLSPRPLLSSERAQDLGPAASRTGRRPPRPARAPRRPEHAWAGGALRGAVRRSARGPLVPPVVGKRARAREPGRVRLRPREPGGMAAGLGCGARPAPSRRAGGGGQMGFDRARRSTRVRGGRARARFVFGRGAAGAGAAARAPPLATRGSGPGARCLARHPLAAHAPPRALLLIAWSRARVGPLPGGCAKKEGWVATRSVAPRLVSPGARRLRHRTAAPGEDGA